MTILIGEEVELVEIELRIVEVRVSLRVFATDRADHLRGKDDVLHWHGLEQRLNPRLVIHAGIEVDVIHEEVVKLRASHAQCDAPITTPVIGNGSAPMRDDKLQRREIFENLGL